MNMEKEEKKESLRRIRRRTRLSQLVTVNGGVTMVANETGTPKSHISAMLAGKRGVGDVLASKLEGLYEMPPGWFDSGEEMDNENTAPLSGSAIKNSGIDPYDALQKVAWLIKNSPHKGTDLLTGALTSLGKNPENPLFIEILERLITEKQDTPKRATSGSR